MDAGDQCAKSCGRPMWRTEVSPFSQRSFNTFLDTRAHSDTAVFHPHGLYSSLTNSKIDFQSSCDGFSPSVYEVRHVQLFFSEMLLQPILSLNRPCAGSKLMWEYQRNWFNSFAGRRAMKTWEFEPRGSNSHV